MRRFLFSLAGLLLIALIAMQFFQPTWNTGQRDVPGGLMNNTEIPDTIAMMLEASCYDCHSNETQYPWYGKLAPVSWLLDKHISEGKEAMNFSLWENYSKIKRIGMLEEICEEVTAEKMPLKSYVLIHKEASLTPLQISAICNWTDKESMNMLKEK